MFIGLSWLHSMRSCNGKPIERSLIVQLTLRVVCLDRLNEFLQWKSIWKELHCSRNVSHCLLRLFRTVRLIVLIFMLYMLILNDVNLFHIHVTYNFEIGISHIRFWKNRHHIKRYSGFKSLTKPIILSIMTNLVKWGSKVINPQITFFIIAHVQSSTKFLRIVIFT